MMAFERIKKLPLVRPVYHYCVAVAGLVLYGLPSRRLFVIGVTGTKGKTTVLELINAILEEAGETTALLSSVTIKIAKRREKNRTDTTMPGRFFIQRFLYHAARQRCRYALVEVTSEGVAQHRHRFIHWSAAFLINLHPEHIEAHGSFEKYRNAKFTFLRYALKKGATLFINRDDANAGFFLSRLPREGIVFYSKDIVRHAYSAPAFSALQGEISEQPTPSFLMTESNRENLAAAVTFAEHIGIREEVIRNAIKKFNGVPGRMEVRYARATHASEKGGWYTVVIDYAHTPESLRSLYKELRAAQRKEDTGLICVLGSAGGGRDAWKRPVIGEIAATYCDRIFLTDEDSYDENPRNILAEIRAGIPASKLECVIEIVDRRAAILAAVHAVKEGDIVVLTGKGSEEWMHGPRGARHPWNESAVVEEILHRE